MNTGNLEQKIQSVKDLDVAGKRVIVRVDFNVPVEKGRVVDDFKIQAALPTLRYLLRRGATVVLMSHLEDGGKQKPSLRPVVRVLEKLLRRRVCFAPVVVMSAAKKEKLCRRHFIILLENLRTSLGEEKNTTQFARELSKWGDVYVNEAFAVSHRAHASLVKLPKLLPSAAGFRFIRETKMLSLDFKKKKPLLFILGGNKFATKVALLDKFLRVADTIFIAGAIGNTFLAARGAFVGKSKIEKDQILKIEKKYGTSKKIKLPIDWVEKNGVFYDIGPETIGALETEIKKSRFVVWNGPVGFFEKGFFNGTKKIAQTIVKYKKPAIVGGGDTVAALKNFGVADKFYFVSTGGGAMIDFLAHGTLPGIDALKQ